MRTSLILLTCTLAAPLAAQQPPARAATREALEVELERRRAALAEAMVDTRLRATLAEQQAELSRALRRQVEQTGLEQARRQLELATGEIQRQWTLADQASQQVMETQLRSVLERHVTETMAVEQAAAELQARARQGEEVLVEQYALAPRAGSAGGLASLRTQQGTPEDSLYRQARETLNRGEYSRAAQLFQTFQERFPNARTAPAALYWRAFALYRAGSTEDLRAAQASLAAQRTRYPNTAQDADAATLQVRIHAALAARGDQQAAAALRAANAQGATCDREDMEIRTEALNALSRQDEAAAGTAITRILSQRDECSVTLRRRAVYHLGRRTDADVAARLAEVARTDPDRNVRADAIAILGRMPGDPTVRHLEQVFTASTDERTQSAIFTALRTHNTPAARTALRRFVERTDLPETMRVNAVNAMTSSSGITLMSGGFRVGRVSPEAVVVTSPGQRAAAPGAPTVTVPGVEVERAAQAFAEARSGAGAVAVPLSEEDAAFLRGIYARESSRAVKSAIITGLARAGGTANEQWLMGIVRNQNEEMRHRSSALSRMGAQRFPIDEVGRLYDSMTDRELRSSIVAILGQREEDAATDKLADIIRNGTDPQLRREAISALTRKKDPRSTRILLELIER